MSTLTKTPSNSNAVYGSNANFASVHDASSGSLRNDAYSIVCCLLDSGSYTIERAFENFDTSDLGSLATISAATLTLKVLGVAGSGVNFNLYSSNHSNPVVGEDFDQAGSVALATAIPVENISAGSTITFTLNAAGIAAISKTGTTKLCVRQVENDVGNSAPSSGVKRFWYDTATVKPSLVITYTQPITNKLSAYWKFDESSGDAADSSGNGNTLTNVNTATYPSGKINNGIALSAASTQYFYAADNASLSPTTAFTWSGWLKFTSHPSGGLTFGIYTVWGGESGGGDYSHKIVYNEAHVLSFDWRNAGGANSSGTITYDFALDTWYHVAVTVNAVTPVVRFYINGAYVSTTMALSNATSIKDSTHRKYLGAQFDASAYQSFNGMMDEIGIWLRVLEDNEISTIYNSGSGRQYPFLTSTPVTVSAGTEVVTFSLPARAVFRDYVKSVNTVSAVFDTHWNVSGAAKFIASVQSAVFNVFYTASAGGNKIWMAGTRSLVFSTVPRTIKRGWVKAVSAATAIFSIIHPGKTMGTGVRIVVLAQQATFSTIAATLVITRYIQVVVSTVIARFTTVTIAKMGSVWRKIPRNSSGSWQNRGRNTL